MASTTPHTILLKSMTLNGKVQKEGIAGTAGILPGDLLKPQLPASGNVYPYTMHGYQANAVPWFAVENPYAAATATAAIDTAYGSGHSVFYVTSQPGDEIYAWLGTGTLGSVAINTWCVPAGSAQPGDLMAITSGTPVTGGSVMPIVGRALEAVNNSAGTVHVRLKVEVA